MFENEVQHIDSLDQVTIFYVSWCLLPLPLPKLRYWDVQILHLGTCWAHTSLFSETHCSFICAHAAARSVPAPVEVCVQAGMHAGAGVGVFWPWGQGYFHLQFQKTRSDLSHCKSPPVFMADCDAPTGEAALERV